MITEPVAERLTIGDSRFAEAVQIAKFAAQGDPTPAMPQLGTRLLTVKGTVVDPRGP